MDESAGRSKANKRSLWGEIEQQDVNHGQPPQQRFKPPSARLRFTALNSDPTPLNMTTGAQPGSGISRGLSGALSWDYNRRNGGPVSAAAAAAIARASGGVTAPSTVGVDAIQLEEQIHNQASGRNHFHPILSSVPSATGRRRQHAVVVEDDDEVEEDDNDILGRMAPIFLPPASRRRDAR